MAGQLSAAGVPVLVADIKGDLTGLALPGDATNAKVQARAKDLGWDFKPDGHPIEFLSLTGKLGAQVRATVHSFGPLLLGQVLDLNETQTSVLSLVFKYCDDHDLALLDLDDLRTTLKYLGSDDGKAVLEDYGGIGPASLGVILRSIVGLEQQGADVFFGEPEFDVEDLMRTTPGRAGDHQRPRAVGRDGQAGPLQHVHALDAGPALRSAPRGRATCRSRSWPSSSTRRTSSSTTRPRRSSTRSSAPSGSSGRRAWASTSSPRCRPTCPRRSWPSSATASSTPCASSRRRTPTTSRRPSGRSR